MGRRPSQTRKTEAPNTNNAPPDRVTRECASCGVTDHHTHHVQYVGFLHPVTKEPVDLSVSKHTQCCAAEGCEICATDIEHSQKVGVTEAGPHDKFTDYMQNKSKAHHRALFERHGVESPDFMTSGLEDK